MMRSLYSGVAGLKTHQTKMDVIGNNIANVNTVAFKATQTTFSDIMYQNLSGASAATETLGGVNAKQIGLGSLTASTKTTIESAGASQSTGEAFDIRLSDGNATNFFIVNDGTQNLFTRAGSFYIDGAGNLAMTSTGYMVQGWQAVEDEISGAITIRKDSVSPLRITQASNQTSDPEATNEANVSGIFDKNDTDINSTDGYNMSLGFYDNLGYLYTAKFTVKAYDTDAMSGMNDYTVKLTSILDENNVDILQTYIARYQANNAGSTEDDAIASLFGNKGSSAKDSWTVRNTFNVENRTLTTTYNNTQYTMDLTNGNSPTTGVPEGGDTATLGFNFNDANGNTVFKSITEIWGVSADKITEYAGQGATYTFDPDTGSLDVTYQDTNFRLAFSPVDGSFLYVDQDGNNAVSFNASLLGDPFENINIDFTKSKSVDNGGSSTGSVDRGSAADATVGTGKRLGQLIGVAVQQNGEIYGSYSNGNTRLLGQIAVAQFPNPSGLEALGNNLFGETLNSGSFDGIGVEITADGGKMDAGSLEMSNVDLSREFTEMITTQRGFQANSRIITVSDTLLEELTNLKR